MKSKEIRDLIDFISSSGLNEVNIETEEIKLSVKRSPDINSAQVVQASAPVMAAVAEQKPAAASSTAAAEPAVQAAESNNYVEIKSPMIGTFYRSPNPETDAYVSVGDTVEAGQTVCIIEAMKLFNEIESDISGTIVKILVEDATPVEYDQPLFLVDPS